MKLHIYIHLLIAKSLFVNQLAKDTEKIDGLLDRHGEISIRLHLVMCVQ